jgi:hypothetical protein
VKQFSKFVGMDVHKATIAVSVADANGGEVRYVGEIANTPEAIEKLVRCWCHWRSSERCASARRAPELSCADATRPATAHVPIHSTRTPLSVDLSSRLRRVEPTIRRATR